jgi:23S rRNA (uracil1939-C5)-methyltransferase
VAGGRLLSRLPDGSALLLEGALPGETVDARVVEEGRGFRIARVERVVDRSPERIDPPCPFFGRCGGCTLQFAPYPLQVEMKREALADALRRIGGHPGAAPAAVPSPLAYGYRHRCRVQLRRGKAGFLAAGSREVVEVPRCLLLADPLNRLLPLLADLSRKGGAGEAHLLTDGERSLAWLPGRKHDRSVVRILAEAGCAGVRFSDREEGESSLVVPVAGLPLRCSAGSFLQANRGANELLVARAGTLLAGGGDPAGNGPGDESRAVAGREDGTGRKAPVGHLLDLYAGGGNFALPLSSLAERVTAVESGADSFRDLARNRDALSVRNCRLVQAPVEGFRPEGTVDALLVDPPRAGLSRGALRAVLDAAPRRLLYVSCDGATFARDLGALSSRYAPASVEMFDLFPQTAHAETLALLLPR